MKKNLLILISIQFICLLHVSAVNITIIQSKGTFSWSDEDVLWQQYATSMGFNATIDTVTVLNDTTFFSTTDVLVFSEAAVQLSDTQLQNIIQFVKRGKSAYIQSEYETSFQGNIAFQAIMDSVKADFNWVGTVSGELVPMLVLGSFATTPYTTDTLNYFNYGANGTGNGVDSFLLYNGAYFGFYYHASGQYGSVITVSDEDWVWMNADSLLMKNILYHLVNIAAGVKTINENTGVSVFPNPSNGIFTVKTNSIAGLNWKLVDILGRQMNTGKLSDSENETLDFPYLPPGNYILDIYSGDFNEYKKITIVK